jgi:hypothetical protein
VERLKGQKINIGPWGQCYKTFKAVNMNFCNKYESLPLVSFYGLVLCLWIRAGGYSILEHLKGQKFTLGPGANVIKLLRLSFTIFSNKLECLPLVSFF